ncbi:serine/threonine protein kinase [Fictibacillus fluitans]|uniref:Protein kinase n=1 Tax=Fictibacillus fluitans TaxID=3058422 RepID=A0ABT8HUM0_9BACL|nr:protein kinase [Fictibacillus sp. NE201]MDN4524470.1 protein kinase [Fictibacillus sp. NE201]
MNFHWIKTIYRFIADQPLPKGHLLFQRYTIEEVIGMGSYGITYRATDFITGNHVAVKQLRRTKSWTEEGRKSFEKEKQILQELSLPEIPTIHPHTANEKGQFLVMDYVAGKNFEDLIFSEGKVYSEQNALAIFTQLVSIVQKIHEKGIIHRDLRIPNIISSGEKLHIIDFGLAFKLSDEAGGKAAEKHRNLMREVSVTSDFYALGHFLLFLLYSGYEPQSKKENSWEEELSLSPGVHQMLRRLLQIDESFGSAEEIIAEIYSMHLTKEAGKTM